MCYSTLLNLNFPIILAFLTTKLRMYTLYSEVLEANVLQMKPEAIADKSSEENNRSLLSYARGDDKPTTRETIERLIESQLRCHIPFMNNIEQDVQIDRTTRRFRRNAISGSMQVREFKNG